MKRSGFWIRLAAMAIDGLIFLVFLVTVTMAANVLEERGVLTAHKERILAAMLYALWLAYSSLEVIAAATLGKMALGLVIALPDGAPAPPWTRVLRWSTKQFGMAMGMLFELTEQPLFNFIGGSLNGLIAIGCLRILGEEKRAWHDLWSHTAVVPRTVVTVMADVHEEPVGPPTPT